MIENIAVTIRPDKIFPLPEFDLLAISGLFGVHPDALVTDNIVVEINPYTDCIRININSNLIKNLQIVVYPGPNYIENQYIRARNSGSGIGAKWVLAQTKEVGERNFRRLTAEAYRAEDRSGDWSGYVVWAKYGYIMQVSDLPDFQKFIAKHNRWEQDLYSLITVPDGLELWISEGFSWDAEFDLADNSESHRILANYLSKKTPFKGH